MGVFETKSFRGAISDYEDKSALEGGFKFGTSLDIRKLVDSLSCNQDLMEIGKLTTSASLSPSASRSPSSSNSPSSSPSRSPSSSISPTAGQSPSSSLSPSSSRSPSASTSISASLSPSSSVSASPSPTGIGGETIFNDLIIAFVPCSDGNTYGFGNTGKIYKIASDLSCSLVYDLHKQIKGAEEEVAQGKAFLVFATNTEIHRKQIPGNVSWNDVDADSGWPKSNLTSADWHSMKQINGDIHIANASTLAFIGFDQSYTNEALSFIPGNNVKTIVERSALGIYGSYPAGYPNKGVNAAIDTELPLAQIGDDGELFYSNMQSYVFIKRFPGGGIVNPYGVTAEINKVAFYQWDGQALNYLSKQRISNLSLWGVYNADSGKNGVYSYGRRNKNHPITLNLEYPIDDGVPIGATIYNNGTLLISVQNGTDFLVYAIDPDHKAIGTFQSLDFKAPVKKVEGVTVWDYAELYMKPLPTGCSVEFWYRINKTGNFVQARTVKGDLSFSTTGGEKAVFSIKGDGEIFEEQIVLRPFGNTCPEVYRSRVYFN